MACCFALLTNRIWRKCLDASIDYRPAWLTIEDVPPCPAEQEGEDEHHQHRCAKRETHDSPAIWLHGNKMAGAATGWASERPCVLAQTGSGNRSRNGEF